MVVMVVATAVGGRGTSSTSGGSGVRGASVRACPVVGKVFSEENKDTFSEAEDLGACVLVDLVDVSDKLGQPREHARKVLGAVHVCRLRHGGAHNMLLLEQTCELSAFLFEQQHASKGDIEQCLCATQQCCNLLRTQTQRAQLLL